MPVRERRPRSGAPSTYQRVYDLVSRVPSGRVVTYGQVAALLRLRGGARQVGYALSALSAGTPVPWHRVINASGRVSLRGDSAVTQCLRLEREGVRIMSAGRVNLKASRWQTPTGARIFRATTGAAHPSPTGHGRTRRNPTRGST